MSGLWKTLKVAAKKKEADDIVSFELIDPAGEPLPRFTAGAHIDVEIAPDLVRQYSLCNAPRERCRYLIGVLRERASRGGSTTLVDTVEPGAFVRTSEPRNHFALDLSAARVVLIAGGIGITPILCMAEHLAITSTPFELHYCTRSRARAAFFDRIRRSPFSNRTCFYFDDAARSMQLDLSETLKQPGPGTTSMFADPMVSSKRFSAGRIVRAGGPNNCTKSSSRRQPTPRAPTMPSRWRSPAPGPASPFRQIDPSSMSCWQMASRFQCRVSREFAGRASRAS
jgi:ferredoxin-NADP reductase